MPVPCCGRRIPRDSRRQGRIPRPTRKKHLRCQGAKSPRVERKKERAAPQPPRCLNLASSAAADSSLHDSLPPRPPSVRPHQKKAQLVLRKDSFFAGKRNPKRNTLRATRKKRPAARPFPLPSPPLSSSPSLSHSSVMAARSTANTGFIVAANQLDVEEQRRKLREERQVRLC